MSRTRLKLPSAVLAAALVTASGATAQTPPGDPLSRARRLYNEQKYDAAIEAATEARKLPALANAATVVIARAHLDRFVQAAEQSDLADARDALKQVNEAQLAPRDQVDFLVGLGQSFYLDGCLDGCYAAAAEQFEQALSRADAVNVDLETRELLLEWWAVTLDRRAQFGPASARRPIYARVLERAEREIARPATSAVGLYWLAAAARGTDDLERAWGAATSGWARARYLGARGEQLRADLDRFVALVLLPERARELASGGDARAALTSLEAQWADWKVKWK
jgi:hypothetical protein